MPQGPIASWTRQDYEVAAQEYFESLPLEHFMESTPHATQRKITLESFDLIKLERPELEMCSELLIQYPMNGGLGQVCPDNMLLETETPLEALGSFNLPFESGRRILWTFEYVSPDSHRKDYIENARKYGRELKIPYYMVFDPHAKELDLFRLSGSDYVSVRPNAAGRLPVPELELEVGLLDGWVRYWFRGRLIPLPAELQQQLDEMAEQLDKAREEAVLERRRAEREAKLAQRQAKRADEEKKRADEAARKATEAKKEARAAIKQAKKTEQLMAEKDVEVERLRNLLAQIQGGGTVGK
jgi:Putative restriction endonuclease